MGEATPTLDDLFVQNEQHRVQLVNLERMNAAPATFVSGCVIVPNGGLIRIGLTDMAAQLPQAIPQIRFVAVMRLQEAELLWGALGELIGKMRAASSPQLSDAVREIKEDALRGNGHDPNAEKQQDYNAEKMN